MEPNQPLFKWITEYQLGIQEFDEHHQKLVQLLNDSFDAFAGNAHPQRLTAIFDELSAYTVYHFAAEESWMKKHQFPRLAEHTALHDAFKSKLAELQQAQRTRTAELHAELFTFLSDWLANHILETDAEYGAFARQTHHTTGDISKE